MKSQHEDELVKAEISNDQDYETNDYYCADSEEEEDNLRKALEILNIWWRNEHIPRDALQARVVLIFKKGNTNDLGNYRPISLLNSLYKIFAAILQERIARRLDKHLQKPYRAKLPGAVSLALPLVHRHHGC